MRAMVVAIMALVMLLPTPPLPLTMPMTFLMRLSLLGASFAGAALRDEQFWLQLLQSWVHSLIWFISPFAGILRAARPKAVGAQNFLIVRSFLKPRLFIVYIINS